MASTTQQHPGLETLETKKAAYLQTHAALEEAKGKGNKKLVLSLGGQLANRSREIREARLDLAEDGIATEWKPPITARSRKQPAIPQPELQARLDKAAKVLRETSDEDMKHGADARITALMKTASKAGYSVKDPRK